MRRVARAFVSMLLIATLTVWPGLTGCVTPTRPKGEPEKQVERIPLPSQVTTAHRGQSKVAEPGPCLLVTLLKETVEERRQKVVTKYVQHTERRPSRLRRRAPLPPT